MLGQGRSRRGILRVIWKKENWKIGQVSALLHKIESAKEIIDEIIF